MACKEIRDRVEKVLAELDAQRGIERARLFDEEHNKKHYHKCPDNSCGHIWSHKMSDFTCCQDFEGAHKCPKCKSEQLFKCRKDGSPIH